MAYKITHVRLEEGLSSHQGVLGRPRVAMIVDNSIEGDSRVQKAAASMADRGWEVLLLGRARRSSSVDEFSMGGATVRRIPVPYTLHAYRRINPGGRWRWPLAYRNKDHEVYQARKIEAVRAELRLRRAQIRLARKSGMSWPATQLGRSELTLRKALLSARITLHRVRARQLTRGRRQRTFPSAKIDHLVTIFWRLVRGRRCWRRLEPLLLDFERAFGPHIERFDPDVIHAHDFRMIGVAVRTAIRMRGSGRSVKVIYDAHEFLPGVPPESLRWGVANTSYEAEYIRQADAVVTVSPEIAEMLAKRHKLAKVPTVVLNAPDVLSREGDPTADDTDVRTACGLGTDSALLVYSGGLAARRGLTTVVEALSQLPNVHLALLCGAPNDYGLELLRLAERTGAAPRLHMLPYVPHDRVIPFLQTATAGLAPYLHYVNHELSLGTKYYDYLHAELPIIASDVRVAATTTLDLGVGEVFAAGNLASFVTAVRRVLADPEKYRSAYNRADVQATIAECTWDVQASRLAAVYEQIAEPRQNTQTAIGDIVHQGGVTMGEAANFKSLTFDQRR